MTGLNNNWLCARRRGSVTVLALMVSLLIMVMITATMTMTIANNNMMGDYARNKRTIQAADSGLQEGRITLAEALSTWNMPTFVQPTDVDAYTSDANSRDRTGNRDISLLVAAGVNVNEILPRGSDNPNINFPGGMQSDGGEDVNYNGSVDIYPTGVDLPPSNDITYKHVFHYNYDLTSEGYADIGGQHNQATRVQHGHFDVEVLRPSFSTYGYFTNHMKDALGSQLWFYDGEQYDGPTFVNSTTDKVAFYGRAHFKGDFSAVQGNPGDNYQTSGAILAGAANPDFQAGQHWGANHIDTPTNGWSQSFAALGDYADATNPTPPTNSQLRNLLGLTPGSSAPPDGVYYAKGGGSDTSPNSGAQLGGIYIQGSPDSVQFGVSGSAQTVTIKMGANTWVIADSKSTNTMTAQLNSTTPKSYAKNMNGVIQVSGSVQSLVGTGGLGTADIQSDEQMTLSANGDIHMDDHLTYQSDPATYPDAKNVLGIFSSGGNVMIGNKALGITPPNNLTINATVMAVGNNKGVGTDGLVVSGNYNKAYGNKGKWNLTGGLIENTDQTTGVEYSDGTQAGYTWNFTYDQRFKNGVAPPYFPYVTKFTADMQNLTDDSIGRKYY
jgi:hypothetical protein